MRIERKKSTAFLQFTFLLAAVAIVFAFSWFRTKSFNEAVHNVTFMGDELFSEGYESSRDVVIKAVPRGSTWSKVFSR